MKKSNKMHVTFTDKVQKKRDHIPSSLRKSSIDSTSSSFSDQSDKTVNETNISLQTSTSVNSMNSQLSINEENPEVLIHEDEENDTFDEHFSQPKNYTLPFLDGNCLFIFLFYSLFYFTLYFYLIKIKKFI